MPLLTPRPARSRIRLRASHRHLGNGPLRVSHTRFSLGGTDRARTGWAPQPKDVDLQDEARPKRGKKNKR